ncbi:MAG: ABC transporter substrate-binding protein [Actinomycetota bacterium]|nr:ABC transporter substrate-binding protein [Actinomycetota bacterium]
MCKKVRLSVCTLFLLLISCGEVSTSEQSITEVLKAPVQQAVGFDGEVIRLGVLADLTGPGSNLDRARLAGIETFWAEVNKSGGIGKRVLVELLLVDHQGEPTAAAIEAFSLAESVVSFAFISEVAAGAAYPILVNENILAVSPTSTLDWESDPRFLTHSVPVEIMILTLFESFPGAKWCVLADRSPLGTNVSASVGVAEELSDLKQGVLIIEPSAKSKEILTNDRCSHLFVELSEGWHQEELTELSYDGLIFKRAASAGSHESQLRAQEIAIDLTPQWRVDSAVGMREFMAALIRHTPDALADSRLRDGYVSQIRLYDILERAFTSGEVTRSRLREIADDSGPVNMRSFVEDIDVTSKPKVLPRAIGLFSSGGEEPDDRGWSRLQVVEPTDKNVNSLFSKQLDD